MSKVFWFVLISVCLSSFSDAKTTINVAVDHAPPYSTIDDNGDAQGLILDILQALRATQQQFVINPVPCPFSRCVRLLSRGEVDVMGGLIRTEHREKVIDYINPPYMALTSSFVFYARKDSDIEISDFTDLYGKRIAVMRGAAFYPQFDDDRELNKVLVPSERVAFDLLLKSRVDLVLAVEDTAEVAMNVLKQPLSQLKKVEYRHTKVIYGYMAFSRSFAKTELGNILKERMKSLGDSHQLDALLGRYQLPPISGNPEPASIHP
ncbi:substrate-binding periplasmic protein [Pseudoalteromonas sp. T1lg65]|uniref:substrate-binding periplasmic protein n=1 Tax=Pseudoalteromonas sp. T1lg65 TaxID=2077101 RepID=UPI003F7ABD98